MTPRRDVERFAHGMLWGGPFDGERVRFVTGPGQYIPLAYAKPLPSRIDRVPGTPDEWELLAVPVARYALRPGPELDSTGAMIYAYQGQGTS